MASTPVPIISDVLGPSKTTRLESLASTRKNAKTPKSVLYYGGRTVPDSVRAAPPSIFAPKKAAVPSAAEKRAPIRDAMMSELAMRKLIAKYDTDHDGYIDERELRNMLNEMFQLGVTTTSLDDAGLKTLMAGMDSDRSGSVSTRELLHAWQTWLGKALLPVRCLLIIDVQNDFISGSLAVNDAEAVVPVINRLRSELAFDVVAYSKDWHPFTHSSFHETFHENAPGARPSELHPSNTAEEVAAAEGSSVFSVVKLTAPDGSPMAQVLWPRHCAQESWGSECHPQLHLEADDLCIYKGTDKRIDSYSAFYDNMKLKSTGLAEQLRAKQVSHVYVVGIALDYCVCFTALHAAAEGLIVTVVEDASRAVAPNSEADARKMLAEAGVRVCTSAELPALMNADSLSDALMAARSISKARDVSRSTLGMPSHATGS